MVLIFLTMFFFIPGSGIGVFLCGLPLLCVSKPLLVVFLLLLNHISFLNYLGVNVNSAVDKIGIVVAFPIQPSVHRFDCTRFVLLFGTIHLASKTGVSIRFRFRLLGTAFGAVSTLASTCSPLPM